MLDELDRGGELRADSRFPNIGLVMSLFLNPSQDMEAYGIGENGEMEWRQQVVAYAKKGKISSDKGTFNFPRLMEAYDALEDTKHGKISRWKWAAQVRRYRFQNQKRRH